MSGRGVAKDAIADTILRMVAERGAAKTVCPSEVARRLAGHDEKEWRLLMKPIKAEAIRLAASGRLVLKRKGLIVDPSMLRGIYRLAAPEPRDGAGSSASVLPEA